MVAMSGGSGGTPPGSGGPGSPGRKRGAVALHVRLACASLDAVKSRYPELADRRFVLRSKQPLAIDTLVRLVTQLSVGTPCFQATAVVERITPAGPDVAAMTLAIIAMDEAGRELVAWMGGKPPRLLKEGAEPAQRPTPAPPQLSAPQPPQQQAPPQTFAPPVVSTGPPRPAAAPVAPAAPGPPPKKDAAPEIDWDAAFPATVVRAPERPAAVDWEEPPAAPPPAVPPRAVPRRAAPPPAAPPPEEDVSLPESWSEPSPESQPPSQEPEVVARAANLRALEADLPPRAPGEPLITPQKPLPTVPPAPPPSRRPAPPPLPRQTLAPAAAPPAAPTLVDDAVPAAPAPGPKTGRIIGIDLGTTNSAAAVVKQGKPFIIPSREGYNTIPSVVALNEKGNLIVGHQALGQLLINPRSTVYGFKRLIGRQFKSPVVTDLVNRFSYEIAPGLRGEASVKLGDKIFSLQKISSLVLGEVKELAERWLGEPVTRAVITVPAYYNDNQRQAVRAAGALAGIDVERILSEPTAAAIAFAHGRALEERVMVYDLGGGTFDTSVMLLHGSVYEVISTGGDTFLGGVDFDKELVNELLTRFKKRYGVDFSGDRVAYQRINDAAERAKISLSERLSTQVKVPFVSMVGEKAYDVDETVTRAELEKLTAGLVERTLRVCDDVLTNCGIKPTDVGDVLLVGGQSRMPMVRSKIKEFFSREPSKAVHPDEAVALGAALLADSIQTGEIGGIVLVDVLPMSIGVGMPGGRFKKIVERNTPLPHRKEHSVWTSEDQQKMLEISIFQGESAKAQENEYLGTLVVADLPPGTKGNVVFDVIFSISPESILTVTAEERGTARSVTATFSTQDTPESVRRRLSAAPPGSGAEESGGQGGLLGWLKRKLQP